MKPVTLPLPLKGENSDSSPATMAPDEAPYLVNVLLHRGNELVRRGEYQMLVRDPTPDEDDVPVGMAVYNNHMLMTWATDGVSPPSPPTPNWSPHYFRNSGGLGSDPVSNTTAVEYTARYWAGDDGIPNSAPAAVANSSYSVDDSAGPGTGSRSLMPFTKATHYDGVTYYTSVDVESTFFKGGGASPVSGVRLVQWAGSNRAATTGHTVTATVGSTTVTFGSTPSGSIVGSFLLFDADATSTLQQFAYKIVSGSGTSYQISRPFGLGVSGVVGRTAVAAKVMPRNVVIQSPTGATCVASFLDRIFVGRPRVRTSTGTLQPGYYANGIQWSQELAPDIWPDGNVAIVGGSDSGDQIMGLQAIGRYLLIFKRFSTWVLSGDSEENFVIKKLLGSIGCIDSRSIVEHNDTVIWADEKGIYRINQSLETDEITQREAGHGVKLAYARAIGGYLPQVTMCVDKNDYLHVMVSGQYEDVQVGELEGVHVMVDPTPDDSGYPAWPKSCYLPKKTWVRFQNLYTPAALDFAVNPQFFFCGDWAAGEWPSPVVLHVPIALGYKAVYRLDRLTEPIISTAASHATAALFLAPGEDESADTTSSALRSFGPSIVWSDLALADYNSWYPKAVTVDHCIEYTSASPAPHTTAISMVFDPATTSYMNPNPTQAWGTILVQATNYPGKSTYSVRLPVDTTPDANAQLRGKYIRFRIFDQKDQTRSPKTWRVFRIAIEVEPGRAGRSTDHLL